MSFTTALAAATTLAREYTKLDSMISGMACASDHDPKWSAADDAELDRKEAERVELARKLRSSFTTLAFEYSKDWQAYLVAATARLTALAREPIDGRLRGEYERDQWTKWTAGRLVPDDQPVIFARGIQELEEHRAVIDRLVPA